ncbi:MAG: HD domain-containing protein [Candidatus Levybacteria bacterium]|nr:HD domain-containing protein [Candidatus Levybacteria bacterium]
MNNKKISRIQKYVKEKMEGESTGHDWFHVERVLKTSLLIAKKEGKVNLFIIITAALLHDLGDWKINNTNKTEEEILEETMNKFELSESEKKSIKEIILNMSFSKNIDTKKILSKEGQIVQDADRLEALGAIGIARAFAYGGKKNREIYNPNIKPKFFKSINEYRNSEGHTINHFYEKLFKIRKNLNTKTAKMIALEREKFMKTFLKEFYAEWDGKA